MCGCGCNSCETKPAVILNENLVKKEILSEGLRYHLDNNKPLTDHLYRAGSKEYFNLFAEARTLYTRNILDFSGEDLGILLETDLGHHALYEGKRVPLDFPIEEAKHRGKKVQLNKPKRGGSKKFFVYVRDPKTKNIKKVSFGGTTGLKAKINDPAARRNFAKRHRCAQKNDKTKAGYWSCRLPRYSKLLGLDGSYTGFW
jgi:hypothetical protein|tara:strand:- start:591 stop:1190 length:600 start_codon:yes stop_codon:yes gene_type:complete